MDPRFDPGATPVSCLDELSLETLVDRVDRHIDSLTTNQIFDAYFGWLHQQIVKDSFTRDEYLLQQWITSLKNHGFGQDRILSLFTDWQVWADQQDPSSRRRYLMIKEELEFSLRNSGSATPMQRKPQSLGPYGSPTISGPTRTIGGRPKITGANDEPMGERKRKRGALPPGSMITEASQAQTGTSGDDGTAAQPASGHNSPRIRMYTPETIYLGSSSPESYMAPGNVGGPQTTKNAQNESKASKPAVSKSLAANPSSTYVCKRCNQEGEFGASQVCFGPDLTSAGHKIQHCPTNLDPNFDKAPDPDYRCDFCKRLGDHFATLCPRNKQPWSLNEQRRLATRAESSKTRTRNKPRSHLKIDSHRPGNCSPLRDNHEGFLRKHKASSAKAAAREPSPQGHERHVSKKAKRRHSKESCRPEGSFQTHDENVHKSRRLDTLAFDFQTDGRLSYENDDFMIGSSPVPAKVASTPSEPLERAVNRFDGPTIHSDRQADDSRPGTFKQASEEAEDFLRSLHSQFQEAEDTAARIAEMEVILDEASKRGGKRDHTLVVDGEGQQWRTVTNPPYGKHVVGLFAGRYVPIVNTPIERQTAAGMIEELDIKASLSRARCLL